MWSVWVVYTNYQASPKKKTDFFSRGGFKPQNFFSDFLAFFCGATSPPCTRSPAQLVALPFYGFGSVRTRTPAQELCATFPKRKKMFQSWTSCFKPVQPAQTSNKTQYTNTPQTLINKGIKKK